MKDNIFPFVKLKYFPNGWRWDGRLKEFIKLKYYDNLKNINDSQIIEISKFLKGSLLSSKIFDIFTWSLYFNPVPNLEIYFICERNSVKGDKFTVFFGKNATNIPVQEIYGFALIYIILLSLIGKNADFIKRKLSEESFFDIEKIVIDKQKYKNLVYNKFTQINFDKNKLLSTIEKFPLLKDYTLKNDKIELLFEIFQNLRFKFFFSDLSKNILVTKESLDFFPKNLIISIAGLICNALKREYSQN